MIVELSNRNTVFHSLTSLREFCIFTLRHPSLDEQHSRNIPLLLEDINSILVIKLRAVGDVLLSTPVIQNLHEHFPHARIDFLTDKFAEGVVAGNPWITNVITFDKRRTSSLALIREVRRARYDLVIDLFSNPRSAVITWMSGARVRVGFPFRWRKYAFTIVIPPRGSEVHNIEFNLDALRRLEIPVRHHDPYFPIDKASKDFAAEWIVQNKLDGKFIVAMNPSGGWYTKRWGLEHYARMGDLISERYDATVLLLWGPGEKEDALTIQAAMKAHSHIIPQTTLTGLGAFIQRCDVVVSNDSGPMHIAAALKVPTLGIFGPTNPLLQGPFGNQNLWVRNEELDCLSCNLTKCPIGNICMTQLEVDRVLKAFDQLVSQSHHRRNFPVQHSHKT